MADNYDRVPFGTIDVHRADIWCITHRMSWAYCPGGDCDRALIEGALEEWHPPEAVMPTTTEARAFVEGDTIFREERLIYTGEWRMVKSQRVPR